VAADRRSSGLKVITRRPAGPVLCAGALLAAVGALPPWPPPIHQVFWLSLEEVAMPLSSLDRARATYLWRLQGVHPSVQEQLADVRHVFAALLGQPPCPPTNLLDEARAAYLVTLSGLPDQDDRLRDLARVVAPLLLAGRCRQAPDLVAPRADRQCSCSPAPDPEPPNKTYWVIWELGPVEAASPRQAAAEALEIQRDPASVATVFTIQEVDVALDGDGSQGRTPPAFRIDLAELLPDQELAGPLPANCSGERRGS